MKKKIGYLGPEGSYSHEVATFVGLNCKLVALEPQGFAQALSGGKIQQAVLPVVNAIGWQVGWVLDLFMSNNGDYEITREVIWNIRSHLIGYGFQRDIKVVYSHAQPLDQCRRFLAGMPGVATQNTASTSAAVKLVAEKNDPTLAAIGTALAVRLYRVPIIAKNISDFPNNQTRFVVLGGEKSSPTGKDTTTLLFGTANKPGALLRVLEIFDALNINMTNLFSMPSPNRRLGECFFLVDVVGHQLDDDMRVAISKIKTKVEYLKALGSYQTVVVAANQ